MTKGKKIKASETNVSKKLKTYFRRLINDITFVREELYLVTVDYYLARTRRNEVDGTKNLRRDALFTYH